MDLSAQPTIEQGYERIGPTAWGMAYRRTFFDIPYSREIFHELQRMMKPPRLTPELEDDKASAHDLQFEARFRLVSRLVEESKADQILEIASGFSPRGLSMAQNPSFEYVELDLPELMRMKQAIVQRLSQESAVPTPSNFHFAPGNALEMPDLLSAVLPFREKPIAVVVEGLLRYLNFQEQTLLARNIHCLLEHFGGAWITPDITVQKPSPSRDAGEQSLQPEVMGGVNLTITRFSSEADASRFFENLGFSIERHSFLEAADDLVLPQQLNLSRQQIAERIGRSVVFIMRVRR